MQGQIARGRDYVMYSALISLDKYPSLTIQKQRTKHSDRISDDFIHEYIISNMSQSFYKSITFFNTFEQGLDWTILVPRHAPINVSNGNNLLF